MTMKTPDISALLDDICRRSDGFEIEATALWTREIYLRYAVGRIHQNLNEDQISLCVRARKNGRIGMAVTNRVDPGAVVEVIEKAKRQASSLPLAEDTLGFTQREEISQAKEASNELPAMDYSTMFSNVDQAVRAAKHSNLEAAGLCAAVHGRLGFATTRGGQAVADFDRSWMNVLLFDEATGQSGWASETAGSPGRIGAPALIQEAQEKAVTPRQNRILPAGKYPVILDRYAAAEIFSILASSCFGAPDFHGDGFISEPKMGQPIFHSALSLWDDGNDPSGCPIGFDYEGINKQRVDLIDQGRLAGAVYDRGSALQYGCKSTGHAQSRLSLLGGGPQAQHLFVCPGSMNLTELIETIDRGIFITRFQYTTLSDPNGLVISGTTRDGTFWIEGGKIQHALTNLTFRQSIIEMLKQPFRMDWTARLVEMENGVIQTPRLCFDEFTIL